MTGFEALWLPILLSAVFVFVASSLVHMVLPWHKGDYRKVPQEDKMRDALRPLAIPPGDYLVPCPGTRDELKAPEFQQKMNEGPVMMLTVRPNGPMTMGKSLGLWFVYTLVVSVFAAYVAGRALPPGTPYLSVFRFTGVTAFLGYAMARWQSSIWYGQSASVNFKVTIDGLIYAGLTAGAFGWLWPR